MEWTEDDKTGKYQSKIANDILTAVKSINIRVGSKRKRIKPVITEEIYTTYLWFRKHHSTNISIKNHFSAIMIKNS